MGIFSNKEAYLGIDIGAHGIKMVELHKTKNRPQLWTYGIVEQDLDIHLVENAEKTPEELLKEKNRLPDELDRKSSKEPTMDDPRIGQYAELLKLLCKKAKVTTRKVTASLPVSYIFHAVLTMPKIESKEIPVVVKAEVEKMLSRPIEELQIVHQIIPDDNKESKYLRILVTAAPKILVKFYSAIFQRAGLELQELETEAFALERSLVGRDQATAMVVDVGAERTNFFIIDKGMPLVHRSIAEGGRNIDQILTRVLQVDPCMVGQLKKDISLSKEKVNPEIFHTMIDPIVKEIEYGFDLFLHQTGNEGKRPEKIILTGGSCVLPFLREAIQQKFPMRVFVGDPWARTVYQDGLRQILDEIGPRMSVAIGLALRNIVQ